MIESETGLSCLDRIGVDRIHLVTVVPSNVHSGMPGMNFQKRRKEALRAYRSTIENAGFEVETHVVRGTPHRRINGIAESIAADLILVGSRGKSPLENRVIGSTARNLARTTVVPLLVDRIERGVDDPDPIRRHLFKRTLFATDFSENAERAFQAFEYLRHATEEVTLVHVESPKDDAGGEADPDERLADLADRLGDWGSTLAPRCGAAIPPRRSSLLRRSTTRVPCSSALAGAAGSDGSCWGASPRRSLPARPGTSFSCRRRTA